jgi:hypothetical protein
MARLVALAVVVAAAASCQIFGLTAPRCDHRNGDAQHACAPDEFCTADDVCAKQGALGSCAPSPAPATRAVHVSAIGDGTVRGVVAMDDDLFGTKAAIIADVHGCNSDAIVPGCAGQDDNPSGTQALGALGLKDPSLTATVLTEKSIRFPAPRDFDEGAGFSFEAVLKTPPRAPALQQSGALSAIVSMASQPDGPAGGVDGFILGVDAVDQLVLQVGGVAVQLTQALPQGAPQPTNLGAIWHHVLCTVDAPALIGGAQDAVLCAIDGKLAPPATPGTAAIASTHTLVVGGVEERDDVNGATIAVARVWSQGRPEPGLRTIDREDALLDEARARLMRYVGVQLADVAAPRFLVTNLAGFPRAEPIGPVGNTHFELVDESWPRVAESAKGATGLLLEPDRRNRLDAHVIGCVGAAVNDGAISPDGRADACNWPAALDGSPSVLQPSVVTAVTLNGGRGKDFAAGTAFVLTGFVRMPKDTPDDGAELHFLVDGATGGGFQINSDCDLARVNGVPQLVGAEQKGCTVVQGFGDWFELIARMTASGDQLTATIKAHGDVWSPQLEIGVDPTTPISFDPGNTQIGGGGGGERVEDFIILDAPDLATATSTAMRATVVSDGTLLSMSPLVVSDDAGFTDHFAVVQALGDTDTISFEPRLELTENATSVVLGGDVAFIPGQPVTLGADLGTPIDPCRRCADIPAVGASLPAAEQWEHIGLLGGEEAGILLNAEVLTDGTEPLPLALDITASAPAPGCLEGASPDVALVACAQGACPEASQVSWSGKAKLGAGPSLDERAIAGKFTAKVSPAKKLDDHEIYFEVRFATSAVSGAIFALNDERGSPFVRVLNQNGNPVVDDGHGNSLLDLRTRAGAWANADEWNQLSCWIGLQPRCVWNADAPVDGDAPIALSGEKLGSVTVGGDGASLVSFARTWVEPATAKSLIDRLVGARVAASFGLPSQERRAAFDVVEARALPSTITKKGVTFAVGGHWPRIIDDHGAVYLADDGEGLTITTRDLTTFVSTTAELAFANTPSGALLTLDTAKSTPAADREELSLVRTGSELAVEHSFRGQTLPVLPLDRVDGSALFFGARGPVMTVQGLASKPSLGLAVAPAAITPLTVATIANTGDRIELRHVRLGTR